jgi:hypothetical protein
MSPLRQRTLGQKLAREIFRLVGSVIVAVIAMAFMYQMIMHVAVPQLSDGLSNAPAVEAPAAQP